MRDVEYGHIVVTQCSPPHLFLWGSPQLWSHPGKMNILLEAFTPNPTDNMADTLSFSHAANDGLIICRKFVGIK